MTHNQHFETSRCSQQINTIEHAHHQQAKHEQRAIAETQTHF